MKQEYRVENGAGTCDACGAPATTIARDRIEVKTDGNIARFVPSLEIKRGCDRHPAVSKELGQ